MSGKLFGQIVLLIVIAAIVVTLVKCGLRSLCKAKFNCPIYSGQQK